MLLVEASDLGFQFVYDGFIRAVKTDLVLPGLLVGTGKDEICIQKVIGWHFQKIPFPVLEVVETDSGQSGQQMDWWIIYFQTMKNPVRGVVPKRIVLLQGGLKQNDKPFG